MLRLLDRYGLFERMVEFLPATTMFYFIREGSRSGQTGYKQTVGLICDGLRYTSIGILTLEAIGRAKIHLKEKNIFEDWNETKLRALKDFIEEARAQGLKPGNAEDVERAIPNLAV